MPLRQVLHALLLAPCAWLAGCGGAIVKAGYPAAWPPISADVARADCRDISGTFQAYNGDALLPFIVSGISDTSSREWQLLVELNERVLARPSAATVTVQQRGADAIDVEVSIDGATAWHATLERIDRSTAVAEGWSGQPARTFRCEADGIVIAAAFVNDWSTYGLSEDDKRRRYRRPGLNDVGTSRGYFDLSKAVDGSLVVRERLFFCIDCASLDQRWHRWVPASVPSRSRTAQRGGDSCTLVLP